MLIFLGGVLNWPVALPIVVTGARNALAFWGVHDENWPGVVLLAAVMVGL